MSFRRSIVISLILLLTSLQAHATLSSDLFALDSSINSLNTNLSSFSFLSGGDCATLGTLNTSIADYINSVETVTAQLSAPLTLTSSDMASLDAISNTSRVMANEAVRLSWELRSMEGVHEVFEYRSALRAMLVLSDDIGTMADRILEMADRILVMQAILAPWRIAS